MPEDASERYADLERAYVEERWLHVQHEGETLLEALKGDGDPQALALMHRVRLLIGHTALYGLRQPPLAEAHYRAVLAATREADLRRIAAEGLELCKGSSSAVPSPASGRAGNGAAQPLTAAVVAASRPGSPRPPASRNTSELVQQPESAASADPAGLGASPPWMGGFSSAPRPLPEDPFHAASAAAAGVEPAAPTSGRVEAPPPAMPWLQDQANRPAPLPQVTQGSQAGGAPAPWLEVEVVEEPELVEVVQADPRLSEELELELSRIRERRAATQGMDAAQREAPGAERNEAASAPAQPEAGPASNGTGEAAVQAKAGAVVAAPEPLSPIEVIGAARRGAPAAPATEAVAGVELAATAPVPLGLEDPDLVAGLLEVNLRD